MSTEDVIAIILVAIVTGVSGFIISTAVLWGLDLLCRYLFPRPRDPYA